MNIKKIVIIIVLLITSHYSLVTPSYAQSTSLSIHPSIISLSLSPGKTSITSLSIKNNSAIPLPLRLRFEPLILDHNANTVKSIGEWITLSNSSLLIPAKKEVIVDIKITLPKTIPLGGYYGMIYVEQLSPSKNISGSQILTKMGVLILGSIGIQDVPLNSIELQNPRLNTYISEVNMFRISFDVKNTALNHISSKPYLVIHPLFGKIETVQFDERLVFPGTKRMWDTQFTVQNKHALYYSADLFVSIGNGLSQKKSFVFIIFPIQAAIILVLCISVIISFIRKRKQIKSAIEILIKG